MPTTYAYRDNVLNVFWRSDPGTYTPPMPLIFGLSTTTPALDGTGITEPADVDYARQTVDFDAPSNGVMAFDDSITFDVDTPYQPTYWFLMDDDDVVWAYEAWPVGTTTTAPTWTIPPGTVTIST